MYWRICNGNDCTAKGIETRTIATATDLTYYLGCASCTDTTISYILHSFRERDDENMGYAQTDPGHAPLNSKKVKVAHSSNRIDIQIF